jgi:DNA repair exonuclease SbcCD ATPase subunit
MTLGIYGAVEIQGHQFELQILEKEQHKLLRDMGNLTRQWGSLQDRLSQLMIEVNNLRETRENTNPQLSLNQVQSLKEKVQQFSQGEHQLHASPIDRENEVPSSKMHAVGLTIISFIGNWIATLCTLGCRV